MLHPRVLIQCEVWPPLKLLVASTIAGGVPTREPGCIPTFNSLIMLDLIGVSARRFGLDRYVNLGSHLAVLHEAQLVGDAESVGKRTRAQNLRTECVEICTVNFVGQELGRGGRE